MDSCNQCTAVVSIDKISPTVDISVSTEAYKKTHTLTVDYTEEGTSGWSTNNKYEYYMSTSSSDPTGGSWKPLVDSATVGGTAYSKNITLAGFTGDFYLFIRKINDGAGNASTTSNYHKSNVIKLDNKAPIIDELSYSDETGIITAKATDAHSGITKYLLKKGTKTSSDVWTTVSATNSQKTTTLKVTSTGTYYFYVEDALGNKDEKYIIVDKLPVTDKDAPTCTLKVDRTSYTPGSNWYNQDVTISFASKSDNVGVTKYYISSNINYKITSNISGRQIIEESTQAEPTTYYGIVEDDAGNRNTCQIDVGIDKTPPELNIELFQLCYADYFNEPDTYVDLCGYTESKTSAWTYEADYKIVDRLSQVKLFGQMYSETAYTLDNWPSSRYQSAEEHLEKNDGTESCQIVDGNVVCGRYYGVWKGKPGTNKASYWNCKTEYDTGGRLGRPHQGTYYNLTISAVDNAGNKSILNSNKIQYHQWPIAGCKHIS